MGEIKRSTAVIDEGILSAPSGSEAILSFPRKGVIMGLKDAIKVKRPNQYKPK